MPRKYGVIKIEEYRIEFDLKVFERDSLKRALYNLSCKHISWTDTFVDQINAGELKINKICRGG